MWHDALWGIAGAAANIGVVFIQASQRVKGWPWTRPYGPGGDVYAVAQLVHLGVAALTVAALANAGLVPNVAVAFLIGATAPEVLKRLTQTMQSWLPDVSGKAEVAPEGEG
jgi:hypothetical protein